MIRVFYSVLTILLLQGCLAENTAEQQSNSNVSGPTVSAPNVIVIVADQMRRQSMGFWQDPQFKGALNGNGDYVVTPNLDELAMQGAVFSDAIANYPLCSPFRGMLLSGLFPHNNGVTNNTRVDRPTVGLRTDIITLTESLANAGYNTALVGKGHWQNNFPLFDGNGIYKGSDKAPGGHFLKATKYDTYIPPGPVRHGIEYWYQTIGHNHKNPIVYTNDLAISGKPEGHPYYPKRYSAVDQADVIIDYIKNTRQQRQSEKAFSILWTMDPPHTPYQKLTDTDEQIYNEYYKNIAIETLLNRQNVDIETAEKFARIHFSMVTLIDREIGRVREALKQQGLAENTLIVFTSDHGEMMGSHGKLTKNFFYEESVAIPLIFHYPTKIKQQVTDLLIGVPDFMPTILGVLGLAEFIPSQLDGKNYASYLLNAETHDIVEPLSSFYYGKESELGVRTDQYTFVLDKKGLLIALYDNQQDPYQLHSLNFEDIPKKDEQMLKRELGKWLAATKHPWFLERKFAGQILYP